MLAVALMTNRFDWLFTYATFWGLHVGYLSLFFILRAGDSALSMDPKARKRGLICAEIGAGYGFLVTLLFWTVLADQIYPYIDWSDGYSIFMGVHMFTLHCVPFITTVINLVIT